LGFRGETRRIAIERIGILFDMARRTFPSDPALAQRYVDTALRIATRCRVRLPREYRLHVCRKCNGFLVPGETCRVRIRQRREPHVAITCLKCGAIKRIPIRGF